MRVLILHSELGVLRGGGENFTRNLFVAFAQRGHRVAAAFAADPNARYPFAIPAGIDPIPIAGWWSSDLGQATLSAIGRHIPTTNGYRKTWDRVQEAFSWRVFRWHKRRFQDRVGSTLFARWNDYDAIYVHGDSLLASMAARYRPTVLRLPGPLSPDYETELRAVHAVCANGDALLKIRAFLGDHAIELPIGLDNNLFRPGPTSIRAKLEWTDQHRVLGYVGRLTHVKGVDLLVAGFRDVLASIPDARLLIVGQGELENSIRSILAKEISGGIAHIEPDVDHAELPSWYRAMNLFVMPSRYENFSNAILEAIACGIPVVASDVGGNAILANEAGYLFEANSVPSLVVSLRRAAQDQRTAKERAERLSRCIRKRYSWAVTAERLDSIIASRLAIRK